MAIDHTIYAGRTFKLTSGQWGCENGEDRDLSLMPGCFLTAIGFFTHQPDILVWRLDAFSLTNGSDDPYTLSELEGEKQLGYFLLLEERDPEWIVFCCKPYSDMKLEAHPKKVLGSSKKTGSAYSKVCPRCGSPAFMLFSTFTCAQKGCDPTKR